MKEQDKDNHSDDDLHPPTLATPKQTRVFGGVSNMTTAQQKMVPIPVCHCTLRSVAKKVGFACKDAGLASTMIRICAVIFVELWESPLEYYRIHRVGGFFHAIIVPKGRFFTKPFPLFAFVFIVTDRAVDFF